MKVIKFYETKDGFFMDSSAYSEYVNSIKENIPENALHYMSAGWHYDHQDPRCLHDAKIESLCVQEEEFKDFKVTNIEMLLCGAYGNRVSLFYSGVSSYSFEKKKCDWPIDDYSHGDWLIDELTLADDGYLIHEIIFTDAVFIIKHKDMKYSIT